MKLSTKVLIPVLLLICLGGLGVSAIIKLNQQESGTRYPTLVNSEANVIEVEEKVDVAVMPENELSIVTQDDSSSLTEYSSGSSELLDEEASDDGLEKRFKKQFSQLQSIEDQPIESTASSYESETNFLNAVSDRLAQASLINSEGESSDALLSDNQGESWEQTQERESLTHRFNRIKNVQQNTTQSSNDDGEFLTSASRALGTQ